jgi:hypothetical protein
VTNKSHETLSASEQAELLRMAGLTPDMVAAVEHSTPTIVADVVIDEPVESHVKVDDERRHDGRRSLSASWTAPQAAGRRR